MILLIIQRKNSHIKDGWSNILNFPQKYKTFAFYKLKFLWFREDPKIDLVLSKDYQERFKRNEANFKKAL
jgi:hypothetical protein